jgi:hypothetical protein
MWCISDLVLTMIAACVWRASCVSALFRQALDVLEVDALRVWSSRKVLRDFTSALRVSSALQSTYTPNTHVILAVLPNSSTQIGPPVPPREDRLGAM